MSLLMKSLLFLCLLSYTLSFQLSSLSNSFHLFSNEKAQVSEEKTKKILHVGACNEDDNVDSSEATSEATTTPSSHFSLIDLLLRRGTGIENEDDNRSLDEFDPVVSTTGNVCLTKKCKEVGEDMKKYLNESVEPCDDFYSYSCGEWESIHIESYLVHILSNDGSEYDNFVKLRVKMLSNIDSVLKQEIRQSDVSIVKHAMKMYQQCVNEDFAKKEKFIDLLHWWPILQLNQFNESQFNWVDKFVEIVTTVRQDVLIDIRSMTNEYSTRQLHFGHSSFILSKLTLQEIYTSKTLKDVASYLQYIHNVAVALGAPQSFMNDNNQTFQTALEIVKFEAELARISSKSNSPEYLIERELSTLKCIIPEINWSDIITKISQRLAVRNATEIQNSQVRFDIKYMIDISKLLKNTPPKTIANYLGWRMAESVGYLLGGTPFLSMQQSFHDMQQDELTKLSWKQCLAPIKQVLTMALARKYAETHLPPEMKAEVNIIADSVKETFIETLKGKEWLYKEKENFIMNTKQMRINVGYPDWIMNDTLLSKHYKTSFVEQLDNIIPEDDVFAKYQLLAHMKAYKLFDGVGQVVNKSHEWTTSLFKVGADYDPIGNVITIPMGILHAPFYDSQRPAYLNFGSIGSFIGHEISHGSMPRYNEERVIRFPWDGAILGNFFANAKCFVYQYSDYYDPEADMNLNGFKTFEEDMSDVAGVKASFKAYNKFIRANGTQEKNKNIPLLSRQFTHEQLFFLSYAQKWCQVEVATQMRDRIMKGSHSPEKYRVNGALSNLHAFSAAFKCPPGSNMNPINKCELW